MSNRHLIRSRTNLPLRLVPVALLFFAVGCGSNSQIIAVNNSGQRLENVAVSADGKSFKFGVLIDGGTAGYMTAEQTFGRNFPKKMTMRFENVDGESFETDIDFKNNPTRKLNISIDDELHAHGTFE